MFRSLISLSKILISFLSNLLFFNFLSNFPSEYVNCVFDFKCKRRDCILDNITACLFHEKGL
uniref:Nodule Cysteine-Rich (NCR) secreted peptide n=1 Tax=Rhizophora mucronata TaxID=61149 RepID=A0A2P2QSP8_RHIMU